jgi:probable biosynthetic protein (TIGR04098 family)
MTVAVNMPQMAAGGLSENWLFKFCGDLHWQRLCASMSTTSARLESESGERLYASFVAISARYSRPLATVAENDVLEESASIARYGSSFFHGRVRLDGVGGDPLTLEQEMVTAFVARSAEGRNDLRKAVPAARFPFAGDTDRAPPALLTSSAQLRKRAIARHDIAGFALDLTAPSLGLEMPYSPSPYVDYNGANLLYYAAYPSILDAGERRLVHAHGLCGPRSGDWALRASTSARDVFYYRNLDLGEDVVVVLQHLLLDGDRVLLHSSLARAADRETIAEAFTVKVIRP